MSESTPRIAVVGAGITGLTTAYRLMDGGAEVTVLEAQPDPGGSIRTTRRDGYVLEHGPHTLLERNRATVRLIDDLGLDADRVVADDQANKRFVVRDGHPVALPMSARDFVETDLFSGTAKLRLAAEPVIPARRDDVDESLANFVRRRLGPEILDYAVSPFVGGIYAGLPRRLSARHAFERLWELEHDYGSLFAGMLGRVLGGSDSEDSSPERRLVSFDRGLDRLIDALAEAVDPHLECGVSVESLERGDDGWHLDTAGDAGPETAFDAVVWAATAPGLADCRIDGQPPRGASKLREIDHPPVSVVALGFDRRDIGHPLDGFGVLVPEKEPYRILGSLFTSTIFPNRAPEGRVLLSTFVGGARAPELADLDDDRLVELVEADLDRLLDVDGPPDVTEIIRWDRAIPQYEVGYGRVLSALDELEDRHPGLYVAGNFRDGISLPELIEAGDRRADRILDDFPG